MKTNRSYLIIVLLLILIFISGTIMIINIASPKENFEYKVPGSHKDINHYDIIHVSEEEMVLNYFNSYIDYIYSNVDEAYDLLSNKNKISKFYSFKDFEDYLKKITNDYSAIPELAYYKIEGSTYYIEDRNGFKYIFETEGVMNYKVSLDTSLKDL